MNEIVSEQGYFRTRDGVRLYYEIRGPKEAPPLLFCYGLVCSKLQWKYQMEYFEKKYRVIYMDYRGHGQSDKPEDISSVTIENLARDLAELHDELALPPLPVFGHSLGVNIILDLYRLHPEKVRGLVLANGTPMDPFETMFHHNFLQVAFPVIHLIRAVKPELMEKFWHAQGKNPVNQFFVSHAGFNPKYAKQEDIAEYLRTTSTVDFSVFMTLLEDFMDYNACLWLSEVRTPVLVMSGERDLITPPKNQRIMAELIPGAELFVVKEGSHCPQLEQVDLINKRLELFLARVEKDSKGGQKLLNAKKGKKPAAAKTGSPKKRLNARSSEKPALRD